MVIHSNKLNRILFQKVNSTGLSTTGRLNVQLLPTQNIIDSSCRLSSGGEGHSNFEFSLQLLHRDRPYVGRRAENQNLFNF